MYNLVELTLNIGTHVITESQKNSLVLKLQMLLQEEVSIVVRNLRSEPGTGKVVLVFYVEKKGEKSAVAGPEVVNKLKEKLRQDSGILQLPVATVKTAKCQNNCSGTNSSFSNLNLSNKKLARTKSLKLINNFIFMHLIVFLFSQGMEVAMKKPESACAKHFGCKILFKNSLEMANLIVVGPLKK